MPYLASLQAHAAITRAPGTKLEVFPAISELLTCPLKETEDAQKDQGNKKKQSSKAEKGTQGVQPSGVRVMAPSECMLTEEQLSENNFPGYERNEAGEGERERRGWEKFDGEDFVFSGVSVISAPKLLPGYVWTLPSKTGEKPLSEMLAMDCEMCTTKEGLELTRITVVNENREVLMDMLVMPDNPILDYNTKYSGITEEILKGVTTRVEDVQEKLLSFIHRGVLLVGHSLENDLKACKLLHPHVIDTSVLFPHQKVSLFVCF